MIVITGATGTLGALVVDQLLTRVDPGEVGVSVRDPARAAALADRGVRVRRGDFADPASLEHAFEGADRVLVVSVDQLGEEAVDLHRAAIDAAYRAGVDRVLYTSHQAAAEDSLFEPARDHARTEAHLAAAGRAHTVLRDGFHAATVPRLVAGAAESGELRAPADGPVSWTTHADLAAAAAVLLTDPDRPERDVVTLTGAEALDLEAVAALVAQRAGRPVRRVVVSEEEHVAGLTGHGVPEPAARMLLTLFAAAHRGEFATVDPALARLVGRPPQGVGDVLASAT